MDDFIIFASQEIAMKCEKGVAVKDFNNLLRLFKRLKTSVIVVSNDELDFYWKTFAKWTFKKNSPVEFFGLKHKLGSSDPIFRLSFQDFPHKTARFRCTVGFSRQIIQTDVEEDLIF